MTTPTTQTPACARCNGEGVIHTGIDEAPTTVCTKCDGTGTTQTPDSSATTGEAPYPYDALFRAIGDAVSIGPTQAKSISVKQFVETLAAKGYVVVAAPQAAIPSLGGLDERTLEAALDAEYPLPNSPHASVNDRAHNNRSAFERGWLRASRAALTQQAAPVAPASEQQTNQAHVLPPMRGTGGQHDASTSVLTPEQAMQIAAEQDYGDEDPKCIMRLVRAIEDEVLAQLRLAGSAKGGNTNAEWGKCQLYRGDSTAATTASASGRKEMDIWNAGAKALADHAPAPSRSAAPQTVLTREIVHRIDDEVMHKPRDYCWKFARAIEDYVRAALAQQGAAQATKRGDGGVD
jgi:hypothetical protein